MNKNGGVSLCIDDFGTLLTKVESFTFFSP